MMNRLLWLLLVLMLPISVSSAQTVKCYMQGEKGIDQVIIASPGKQKSKPQPSIGDIRADLYQRYVNDRKTIKRLGHLRTFECVDFKDKFSSEQANRAFTELNY
ncbi:hypothetical protein ACRRS0_02315 [Agarivorans sp. QJM3NY_29]|uniref:hypothetical protein n=1 Tax=unclassified Agarivorans TaxID=2636026 RepID=UPI003D7EB6FD